MNMKRVSIDDNPPPPAAGEASETREDDEEAQRLARIANLLPRAKAGDQDALAGLIADLENIVRARARRFYGTGTSDFDDFAQEARIAIIQCVQECDADISVYDFLGAAKVSARRAASEYRRRQYDVVVTRSVYWRVIKARQAGVERDLDAALEIVNANRTFVSKRVLGRALEAMQSARSLDAPLTEDGLRTLHHLVSSNGAERPTEDAALNAVWLEQFRAAVSASMDTMSAKERAAIETLLRGDALGERSAHDAAFRARRRLRAALAGWEPPKSRAYIGVRVKHLKHGRRYFAQIKVNGRCVNSSVFDSLREAARAYDAAALKYHGDKAVLNFPEVA